MKTLLTMVFPLLVALFSFPCGSVWGTSGTIEITGNTTLTLLQPQSHRRADLEGFETGAAPAGD
jgi:hypothetical protein